MYPLSSLNVLQFPLLYNCATSYFWSNMNYITVQEDNPTSHYTLGSQDSHYKVKSPMGNLAYGSGEQQVDVLRRSASVCLPTTLDGCMLTTQACVTCFNGMTNEGKRPRDQSQLVLQVLEH